MEEPETFEVTVSLTADGTTAIQLSDTDRPGEVLRAAASVLERLAASIEREQEGLCDLRRVSGRYPGRPVGPVGALTVRPRAHAGPVMERDSGGGCALCGSATAKQAVSPFEEVSARYCSDCETLVEALDGLTGAGPVSDQTVFHLAALERLRRLETAAHHLVGQRIRTARFRGAAWDDICQAVGMPEHEIKRTYPLWPTAEKDWVWG